MPLTMFFKPNFMKNSIYVYPFIFFFFASFIVEAQRPIAHFDFENVRVERSVVEMVRGETYVPKEVFGYVTETVHNVEYDLEGKYYKQVKGVSGNALLLDGYTAYINLGAIFDEENDDALVRSIPDIENAKFTIETWLALGAYPKNTTPLWSHRRPISEGSAEGYSLELDAWGRPVLKVATKNGKTEDLMSDQTIKLRKWTHVAASYSYESGMSLYIDGELIGNRKIEGGYGEISDHGQLSILIGKSRVPAKPTGTIRPYGTNSSNTYIDGIIDEIKLFDRVLSDDEIKKSFKRNSTSEDPELPVRKLPSGPQTPGVFRAVNTTLDYYPSWDAPWATGENADIVVQFDESDCKFVFWRGTSYIPSWVTENGIHYNNGFNEGWNDHGSCEPMSDKKAKYSSVKIVESNPARVVVKWRYGLVDVLGTFAFEDSETGWGDWTNETYYIYPDMTAVRKDVLLSNAPHAAHEWQESMMVLSPGQRPEDVLEYAALTLGNIEGDTKTFSWEHQVPPGNPQEPKDKSAQIINTKSEYRPFSAIRAQDIDGMDVYAGEIRREVSVFPWWNHWPVAPRPTDGRYANYEDRAAHASLSHWFWNEYESTDRSMTKIMLCGMIKGDIQDVIRLNRSWSNPAEISVTGAELANYRPDEKAYYISEVEEIVNVELNSGPDSPIVNPAFVIKNWGNAQIEITVNGIKKEISKNLRVGYKNTLESKDIIIWMRNNSDDNLKIIFKKI
ncbi:MAG: hypothetical protein CBB92_06475 [Flammeovirgaceae bacterium TMED32]|nr:MAG: hypothetical protein CBB92_06475 [Flammeovirgaceae bacterium TMED32]